MASIGEIIREEGASLMEIPGVTGVGQTEIDGKQYILVMLEQRSPEMEAKIPSTLGGYPVTVEVSGIIQAHKPPSA